MLVIDTNVLVYAANTRAPEHGRCRALVEGLRLAKDPWHLTWGIAYEFVRVMTHPVSTRSPLEATDAWQFITQLLRSPSVSVLTETERHEEVAADVFAAVPALRGTMVFDARTAILMKEHGITRIITRDTDFFRFPFLEVIDPLQAPPGRAKEGRVSYGRPKRRAVAARS